MPAMRSRRLPAAVFPLLSIAFLLASCDLFRAEGSSSASTSSSSSGSLDYPAVHEECAWTFIFYQNADNNLEAYMMDDMAEIKNSLKAAGLGESTRVVAMIDRSSGYSADASVFGEDFTGTRLYQFDSSGPKRIGGGECLPRLRSDAETELDLGSIASLKGLIRLAKEYYPARHYALVMGDHGSGLGDYDKYGSKAISYDDTNSDFIRMSDFRSGLTAAESVDIVMLDACLMNYAEIAYQIAPIQGGAAATGFSADYLLASPNEVVVEGFPYDSFFTSYFTSESAASAQGKELTGAEIGELMLSAQAEHLATAYKDEPSYYSKIMTYSLLDLRAIDAFKAKLDALAAQLSNSKDKVVSCVFKDAVTSASISNPMLAYYFPIDSKTGKFATSSRAYWIYYPGIDAYSLLMQLKADTADFSETIQAQVSLCIEALDATIIDSFGCSAGYPGFEAGKQGLALFFPKGRLGYPYESSNSTVWSYSSVWYNPTSLAWCTRGASSSTVTTWYEMLDSWW
jgi:clostripain